MNTSMSRKRWIPNPTLWKNEDAFILGGGPSLRNFEYARLQNELVVGCNDAYVHGPLVCDFCVFGDFKWWRLHHKNLEKYVKGGGVVVTNEQKVVKATVPVWLKCMARQASGLSKTALGWNVNTGAAAINLALILGATRVFLLGFDMKLGKKGESNWHKNTLDKPKPKIYNRMIRGYKVVLNQLPIVFPGTQVINVNDDTALKCFPVVKFDKFWRDRNGVVQNTIKEAS